MTYAVKEMFFTLQGEGANAGKPAVFCRFSGCNLWSGREEDRGQAICNFCDTDFVGTDGPGGGKFASAESLAQAIASRWPKDRPNPFVVFTGGEPALQLDDAAVAALHRLGLQVAVETNGTLALPKGLDWVCVSPKAKAPITIDRGHELKLVYPQDGLAPETLEGLAFRHFFLQPMDGSDARANLQAAIEYCLKNPRWRLSLQIHKVMGIP
jgi:7-carboxy-7-deazaguanine synthase (Cx14CxxC type)